MKQPIKISACLLLGAVALLLAGCGSHDQNGSGSASGGTPPDVVQKAKQQAEDMQNHPPPQAYVPPGHTPGH